ncbi:MAG: hypothetical protein QXX56_02305 [Candidatus Bathyarchaeia archaeon]
MRMVAVAILLLLAASLAQQENLYTIERCYLTVYRDGVVQVHLSVSVDELEPYIVLPLLSSTDKINSILVLDENNEVLDYDYGENGTIVIYTLGARQVKLEYETIGLTSMEHGLWTLKLSASFKLTVRLPKDAVIIYINAVPDEIRPTDEGIELTLHQGKWEVSYEVPIRPPAPSQPSSHLSYYVIAGACIICAFALVVLYFRRRTAKGLNEEEMEVIRYIRERGGRVLEAELRERFPHIPRTSMWRLIRRLEKRGIVQVRKVGLQNVVELK